MRRRNWVVPLGALALMVLASLACNRSAQGGPTLVPTIVFPSGTPATSGVPPALSVTSSPTASATSTPSATASATPTPSPTATATPTPLPEVLIAEAEGALHAEDYAAARAVYEMLPIEHLDATDTAQARLGLAKSLLGEDNYGGAVKVLREFLDEYADHPLVADFHFVLAEALMGQGEYENAIAEYLAYVAQRDVIASYVYLWIGDAHTLAGAYDDAVDAYQEALTEASTLNLILRTREKIGLALGYAGHYADAVAQYDVILAAAKDGNLRARVQYQAAQTLLLAGERDAAYDRLYDLVANYFKTPSAYDALMDLIDSGQPVDDFQRGIVDYYNDAYDAAVAAFYRFIEADLDGHPGDPHYYAGLSYRAADNYAAAVMEFDKLIDTHPGDPYIDDAWLAKAWTQYLAGDDEGAVETYTRFVEENPYSGLAPEALWWVANIRFWNDDYERAEPLFSRLADDYSTNEYAADALYRAAFCRYRRGDYLEAEEKWQRYAVRYPSADLVAGAHFWRGRAYLSTGETISATQAFSQAVEAGPHDYYSQRAFDFLAGLKPSESPASIFGLDGILSYLQPGQVQEIRGLPREPFVRRPLELDSTPLTEDVERAAADLWLADWLDLSDTEAVTLSQLSPVLAADPRLQRGEELWRLGRREESKEELEWLRVDTARDLRTQYQLAIFFRDLGLYRSSILAANAAIRLSPARSPFDAPPFLARLAYPTYYADLVVSEAEVNDLDPILVFSLIHQESLFEGFATSYAYAHGLMQIIPSTGRSIARSLDWPEYETSDLYRPYVSVKFGSWYLARQRDTFDGLTYAALAAYNAGPGNARRWVDRVQEACLEAEVSVLCPFDYDLFVEIISLRETRLYVRQIYKHFSVYRYLYGKE